MSLSASSRLDRPVDPTRDHALGEPTFQVTLVEYGSYTCTYCHAAHEVIADLRDRFGDRMRYVFRQRPTTASPEAREAAELAEYAWLTTGKFWPVHDALMKRGPVFGPGDFDRIAADFDLPPRTERPEEARLARERVDQDVASAHASGVVFTPTFFVDNRRYEGPWDESSLSEAILGSLGHRIHSASVDFARWGPSTGLSLLLCSILAVVLTNSAWGDAFTALWRTPVGVAFGQYTWALSLQHWVNDGLLTVFFLVVGLEIKREFTVGRLATRRAAAFPVAAAIGGMVAPALLYLAVAPAGPLSMGWGVPIATDTAFAVAIIVMLGDRVPVELRVFLTAAVIIDDLVAIALVALFYTDAIHWAWVGAAVGATTGLGLLNRASVHRPLPYVALGGALWFFLHESGIHATLAGVLLAITTPTRPPANLRLLVTQAQAVIRAEAEEGDHALMRHGPSEPALRALDAIHGRIESPADKLLRTVEPWSSYFVLPVFALANAGVALGLDVVTGHGRLMAAIALGLVVGKPLGMFVGSAVAGRLGVAEKPTEYSWRQLTGAGALAGIGFTMSLFIAGQAFDEAAFQAAKLAIFGASILAAVFGALLLFPREPAPPATA